MYVSMCFKDVGDFKKGQFFDTYHKDYYVFIRPEMTEEPFKKLHEADHVSSFIRADSSLSLRASIKAEPVRIFGFSFYPYGNILYRYEYYNFKFLNHKLSRKLQSSVFIQVMDLEKYIIHQEVYEVVTSILDSIQRKLQIPYITQEDAEGVINDFAKLLETTLKKTKAGPLHEVWIERDEVKHR